MHEKCYLMVFHRDSIVNSLDLEVVSVITKQDIRQFYWERIDFEVDISPFPPQIQVRQFQNARALPSWFQASLNSKIVILFIIQFKLPPLQQAFIFSLQIKICRKLVGIDSDKTRTCVIYD